MSGRDRLRRLDPGLLLALLSAALAAWPLLTRASLPTLTDAHHHVYRTFEVLAAWREGVLYPRWAPDFYYGFGYPVFNYYAPLSYYLAAAYGLIFGPVAGVKFVFVLSAGLGAAGVYRLARGAWGAPAGVVAAASFALAPYLAYIDPIMRGALPEALAIALGPWLLLAFTSLARAPTRRRLLLAAVCLAALVLAHNLMSFVFAGLAAARVAWGFGVERWHPSRRAALRPALAAALAVGLAAGLTAFFWLPAALERGAVQYSNAFTAGQARRFIPAAELFAPASVADARIHSVPDFTFRLGLPQWLLGAAGLLGMLRPARRRAAAAFYTLTGLALVVMILPLARPVWDAVPALYYLQFAWRLLGAANLCLAVAAGAGVAAASARWPRRWAAALPAAAAAVFALAALPVLSPLPWPEFGAVNRSAIVALELYGRWGIGTTSHGEFLPVTAPPLPQPEPSLLEAYAAGYVDKIDHASFPAEAALLGAEHGAGFDRFTVQAPASFALRVLTFYFPGWRAFVDGQPAPILLGDARGLMAVQAPPGTHTIELRFADTWPRTLGWWISISAALAGVGLALAPGRRAAPAPAPAERAFPLLGRRAAWAVAGVLAAGIVLRAGLDAGERWRAARDVPQVPGAQAHFARFEHNLALAAYDLPQTQARPGEAIPLTLYWQATGPVPLELSVFVHVYNAAGELWGQSDKPDPVYLFPTSRWPLGVPMRDDHSLQLAPETPPGSYRVALGLWHRASGARVGVLDADGADKLFLPEALVVAP
jgi:hypothetical protein